MKRVLFVVGLIAAIALGSHKADATTCSVPNLFTNGTAADANQVNANFSALQTCGNNIDHTNIGNGGVYATQIIPTTVGQAIFGGTVAYQFSNGLVVNGGLTLGTFLGIASGGTNAGSFTSGALLYFDGTEFNSATVSSPLSFTAGALSIGSIGQSNVTNGYVDLSTTQSVGGAKTFTSAVKSNSFFQSNLAAGNFYYEWANFDTGSIGAIGSANTGSVSGVTPNAWELAAPGVHTYIAGDTSGNVGVMGHLGASGTYVPPSYTISGASVASSQHTVSDNFTGTGTTTTVTLSGSAAYTSATTFSCTAIGLTSPVLGTQSVGQNASGSSVTFNTNNGSTYRITCAGT